MGSPLSSIIAEVFIDRLERWTLKYSHYSTCVLWSRYIDDIFCIWRGSNLELKKFHVDLHKFDEHISFTVEIENCELNFLDLNVKPVEDEIIDTLLTPVFSIYHKPTYTAVSINHCSLHPTSHKLAIIKSAVNCLLCMPLLPEDIEKETRMMESIAKMNSLKINVQLLILSLIHISEPTRPY